MDRQLEQSSPLAVLLDRSQKLLVFPFGPLTLAELSCHGVVPSLPAVLVGSPRKFFGYLAPVPNFSSRRCTMSNGQRYSTDYGRACGEAAHEKMDKSREGLALNSSLAGEEKRESGYETS
jgi:hypothetical protein